MRPAGLTAVCVLALAFGVMGGFALVGGIVTTFLQPVMMDVTEWMQDKIFSLQVMRCIGACGLAPAMTINEKVYKQVNPNKLHRILGMLK